MSLYAGYRNARPYRLVTKIFADKPWSRDPIAGFLEDLADCRFLGRLAGIDHPGDELDDPTARAYRIVPTVCDRCRCPELLDQHHRTRIGIEQQRGDSIAALEH